MGSRKKVRPTPVPAGPALVAPAVGLLVLSLGSAAGCKAKPLPPMDPPGEPYEQGPMDVAPMDDPGDGEVPPPPMLEPMPPPEPEEAAEPEPPPPT